MTVIKTETKEGRISFMSTSTVMDIYPYTNQLEIKGQLKFEGVIGFKYCDDDSRRRQPNRRISCGFFDTKEEAYEAAKKRSEEIVNQIADKIVEA